MTSPLFAAGMAIGVHDEAFESVGILMDRVRCAGAERGDELTRVIISCR